MTLSKVLLEFPRFVRFLLDKMSPGKGVLPSE